MEKQNLKPRSVISAVKKLEKEKGQKLI